MAKKDLKAFLKENKFTIASDVITEYKTHLQNYLQEINIAIQKNESEEHLKGILVKFLRDYFYFENKYTINTSSSIDAAISKDNKLQVLIETKKPSNTLEMITESNLNKKALWEIILYYIEATRSIQDGKAKRNPDSEIKNLVITDCKKFFVFDSQKVEFIVKGELEKYWEKWKNNHLISPNKDIFYAKAKEFFENEENVSKLDYVYFDIEDLSKTQTGIASSYKILSRQILLKDNVNKIVASPLNSAFYQELLYILGLKEVKEQSKTLIKINFDVENTFAVQVYKYLRDDSGLLDENEIIDKTFSSIIVWTNRLLFIKLFEGQLLAINGDKQEYRILDKDKIKDENDLQSLFFKILGTKNREIGEFFDKFKDVPYLNSSLFELYDVEKNYIRIRDIDNNEVVVKPHSKTKKQGKLKLVEYVIDFLNSYNFSSVSVGESETTSGKEIIDAAVLGLIFEKINGYKDGSYYTPSSITEYICKETIESAVIQKVNEFYNQQLGSFDDLILFASDISKKKQINEIINSLKICDPAVGSGHFLVSALNRIIAIKSELGVLFYHNENKLLSDYEISVVNDILTITDGNGELFKYNRANTGSLKVQKTIFCEKRQIIENCLFGVDINDKAVSICQLRLWIELLKNAYYENNVMETLPNIDINIKCGNSLVHKLPVEVGKKLSGKADKDLRKLIAEYKLRVNNYKQESNKLNKQQIKNAISTMKSILHQSAVQTSMDFMGDTTDYAEINLMKNAFEWAIEFPEVLSDDGTFLGFDCVIGNPPYVSVKEISSEFKNYYRKHFVTAQGRFNLFTLLIECGLKLLKTKSFLSYIHPDGMFTNVDYKFIREHLILNSKIEKVIYLNSKIFDAAVDTAITIVKKTKANGYSIKVLNGNYDEINTLSIESVANNEDYLIPVSLTSKSATIIDKMNNCNVEPLNVFMEIQQGIIYSGAPKDEIFSNEVKSPLFKKCLDGRDVLRWYINWENKQENRYIEYSSRLHRPREERLFLAGEKLLLPRKSTKINCGYDNQQFYALNTAYIGLIKDEHKDRINLKFLLGVLNSKLMDYYYKNKYLGWQIVIPALNGLPIARNESTEKIIADIVDKILSSRGTSLDILEKQLDDEVYKLYGLTPEEIALVEESVK